MNTMTLSTVVGLFIVAPAIIVSMYKLNVLSKKLIQQRNYQNPFIRSTINISFSLLVPTVLIAIYRIVLLISVDATNAFLSLLFIASSVVIPTFMIMHSSSYLTVACSHYKKAGSKVNYDALIRVYVFMSAFLVLVGAFTVYMPVLSGTHGIPGIVILWGPSMYAMYMIFFGYSSVFLMKIHQFFKKTRDR